MSDRGGLPAGQRRSGRRSREQLPSSSGPSPVQPAAHRPQPGSGRLQTDLTSVHTNIQGCFIDSVVDDDDGGCVIRCFMEDTQQNKSPCLLTAAGRQWKNAPVQVKLLQLS